MKTIIGVMEVWLDAYDQASDHVKNPTMCGLAHGFLDLLTVVFIPIMCWYYIQLENPEVEQVDSPNWRYEERFQEQQGLSLTVPAHNWMEEGF